MGQILSTSGSEEETSSTLLNNSFQLLEDVLVDNDLLTPMSHFHHALSLHSELFSTILLKHFINSVKNPNGKLSLNTHKSNYNNNNNNNVVTSMLVQQLLNIYCETFCVVDMGISTTFHSSTMSQHDRLVREGWIASHVFKQWVDAELYDHNVSTTALDSTDTPLYIICKHMFSPKNATNEQWFNRAMDNEPLFFQLEAIALANDLKPDLKMVKFTNCIKKISTFVLNLMQSMPIHLKFCVRYLYNHLCEKFGEPYASQRTRFYVYETLLCKYFKDRGESCPVIIVTCRIMRRIIYYYESGAKDTNDTEREKIQDFISIIEKYIANGYRDKFLQSVLGDVSKSNIDLYMCYDMIQDKWHLSPATSEQHKTRFKTYSENLFALHHFFQRYLHYLQGEERWTRFTALICEISDKISMCSEINDIRSLCAARKRANHKDMFPLLYFDMEPHRHMFPSVSGHKSITSIVPSKFIDLDIVCCTISK